MALAPTTPARAELPQKTHEHGRSPSLFLLGPLARGRFEQLCKSAKDKHSVWGRGHEPKVYADLFENAANPFDRHPSDQLVLLLTLEPGDQLPDEYADLLSVPWPKLRARLEKGESVEDSGSARDMKVLVLAAQDRSKLDALVLASKQLATVLGSPLDPSAGAPPSLFFLGPLSGERFEQIGKSAVGKHNVWGRPHQPQVYADLLENKANPFDRHPGDQLVLLVTLEPDGQLPKKYEDLLPAPWPKLRARLEHGETLEEAGSARDLQVLVLAAPDGSKLDALVQTSKPLASLLGSPLVPSPGRPPSLFFLGPSSPECCEQLSKSVKNKHNVWARPHEPKLYADLFENTSNPFDRRPGDVLVLFLTLESDGRPPEKYADLLPSPWSEIEARLERGESFEAEGTARDLHVLALAAPKRADVEALAQRTELLGKMLGGEKR